MAFELSFQPLSPDKLIADPLYQVNLILWMLQPSATTGIKPLLRDAGFEIYQVEPELGLPIELRENLLQHNLTHSNPVRPDLLIRSSTHDYILIECKSRMFGSETAANSGDSQRKQARSLLLLGSRLLASALALQPSDVRTAQLLYLSQHEVQVNPITGVANIAIDLQRKGYPTCLFGLLGLLVKGDEILLQGAYPSATLPASLQKLIGSEPYTIQTLEARDTDPRPLYLIPWMPNDQSQDDEYSLQVFANRILAAAVEKIGPCTPPCEIKLELGFLLNSATSKLYDRWRYKDVRKNLQRRTKELLRKNLTSAVSDLTLISLQFPERGWTFEIPDKRVKDKIVEGLRKGVYQDWHQPAAQPSLFDEED